MTSNNSFTFNLEPYDLYGSFYKSIVGLELARRGLHHTFYGCFGYVPNLPAIIDQRELIASEFDRKGRVLREVRVWDKGLVEIKFTRSPETRRYIETWGYFDSRKEAAQCLSLLGKHLPPGTTQLHDGTVSVSFWNAAMERGDCRARRESQTMRVPLWQEIAANYPERVRSELAHTMRLRESRIPALRLMLWRGHPRYWEDVGRPLIDARVAGVVHLPLRRRSGGAIGLCPRPLAQDSRGRARSAAQEGLSVTRGWHSPRCRRRTRTRQVQTLPAASSLTKPCHAMYFALQRSRRQYS